MIRTRDPTLSPEQVAISIEELNPKEHGCFLCYPGVDLRTFSPRIRELRKMGIEQLIMEGFSKVGRFGVLGKGCVSIVVKAKMKNVPEILALKIRRTDANRPDMVRDFELQKIANSFGVGPRAFNATKNFFAMEFIESIKISKWLKDLRARASKGYTRSLIRSMLDQAFLLDVHGLDHGELSNPSKHILIRKGHKNKDPKTVIIDYESASTARRVANLTSVSQFLFLSGAHSEKIRKVVSPVRSTREEGFRSKFINSLREYKRSPKQETLEKILAHVHCL